MTRIIQSPIINTKKIVLNEDTQYVSNSSVHIGDPGYKHNANISTELVDNPVSRDTYDISQNELELANTRCNEMQAILNNYDINKAAIYEKSHQDGFDAGFSKGSEAASCNNLAKSDKLNDLINSIVKSKNDYLLEIEDEFVEIILAAVVKIVGDIAPTEKCVKNIVRNVIKSITNKNEVEVLVSPEDIQLLTEITDTESSLNRIKLSADSMIEAGGCIIRSDAGSLDARLDVQLGMFKEIMLSTYEKKRKTRVGS